MKTCQNYLVAMIGWFAIAMTQSLAAQQTPGNSLAPKQTISATESTFGSLTPVPFCGDWGPHSLTQSGFPKICESVECGTSGWFFRGGPGTVIFGESARIESPTGTVISGASIEASENTTFLFDLGYQISEQWSITLTTGFPPETTISGTGPLLDQVIGNAHYVPTILAVQRHFSIGPCSTFYVGGGINYTIFYETEDGLFTDFHIDNAVEGIAQLGVERRLSQNFGLYADLKKIWLDVTATGQISSAPSIARLKFNPTLLNFGITYRF